MSEIGPVLLYTGSIAIIVWGIAHIIPTQSVVSGFGAISQDNLRILTMEWIAEGLTFCFIGALTLFLTLSVEPQSTIIANVYRICAIMLIVMAVLSLFTGARTSIIFFKICPAVKTTVAVLLLLGTVA